MAQVTCCDRCLLIPRCRTKLIECLIIECSIVKKFLEFNPSKDLDPMIPDEYNMDAYNESRLRALYEVLKPDKWHLQ